MRSWLVSIASQEEQTISSLSYIFCTDDYLLELNKKYLDHDYYTDILSFPLSSEPIEGDVFISIDRVKENAKTNNVHFELELHRVMAHGLLHFCGYDDHLEKDKNQMRQKEDLCLTLLERIN